MRTIITRLITGIIVSFYFFPVEFTFAPGVNTKMVMAAIGIAIFGYDCLISRELTLKKEILISILIASMVSISGLISTTVNNTSDYAYTTYVVSMIVWLSGAYSAITAIKFAEGEATTSKVIQYLSAVCVFQCISAMMIQFIPAFSGFVDRWLHGFGFTDLNEVKRLKRLYGIGATLDVAGTRFAAVLIMMAANIRNNTSISKMQLEFNIIAFIIITVIGCMIGRTTIVGMAMAVALLIISSNGLNSSQNKNKVYVYAFTTLLLVIPVIIILYNRFPDFYQNIRFAFEGFFSLFETGEWHTNSGDHLEHMYIWPETIKTWIIGDAYFQGAANDINFIGNSSMTSYYMGTDVGYCRFIFYFGLVGLLAFSSFIIHAGSICRKNNNDYNLCFILITILNFLIWLKVSTDIFLVLALFMLSVKEDSDNGEEEEKLEAD